jgi:hypothetical protein
MDSDKEKMLAQIKARKRDDAHNQYSYARGWNDALDAIAAMPFFAAPSPAQAVGGEQPDELCVGPYRGHQGIAQYDPEAKHYHGRLSGIRDIVTFVGDTPRTTEAAFMDSVDDYLEQSRSAPEAGAERPPMLLAKDHESGVWHWHYRSLSIWESLVTGYQTAGVNFAAVDRARSDTRALEIYDAETAPQGGAMSKRRANRERGREG